MTERLPLRVLPFRQDSFDWNRFESFCLAIVRSQPEVKRAARYGDVGEKQMGIDIEADLVDGRKRTVQCRHRKNFNKSHAEKTVDETQYEADEHEIWVTGSVSRNASDFIGRLEGWAVESAEGIGQKLRLEIPRERARLIVADAFGARASRAFLGPDAPLGFLGPDDFFAPFDKPDHLLRHDLPLVGRQAELDELVEAVAAPSVRVVVLTGRGGIGKTRLLREAAEVLCGTNKRVLFVLDGGALSAEVIEDLPLEDAVVFVDDAHRPDLALAPLLAATRRTDPLTIVLGARPAGLDRIVDSCARAGLEPHQTVELRRLDGLDSQAVQALAEQALGGGPSTQVQRLAEATEELPLLTVVGGRLLASGAFSTDDQTGPEELRRSVMYRFVAEQRGRITPRVPEAQAQELLTLLAALGPLDTANEALVELIAEELGVAQSKFRRWLGDVQDAGLLLQRGNKRRLTPDILGDEVLFDACVDQQGRPTGRALELWQRYGSQASTELLINLGELDWRMTASGSPLLGEVWRQLIQRFLASDAWGRMQMIDLLAPAAVFAPEYMLELIDRALANPAPTSDWSFVSMQIDDHSVREKLPVLLAAVGRHRSHVRAAMLRLWKLGRDDIRPIHAHSDHPLRILRELGGYQHDVGFDHHQALIDLVSAEVATSDVDDHAVSPLYLLEALVARDGMHTQVTGLDWQIHNYWVHTEATEPWRKQVRALLVEQALDGSPRQRVAAAKVFEEALNAPRGSSRAAPEEIQDEWRQDNLRLLDAVNTVVEVNGDPALRAKLSQALRWHADYGRAEEVRERAITLLKDLEGPDEELLAAISWPWEILDEQAKADRDRRVAAELEKRYADGGSLAAYLETLLADVVKRGMTDAPSADMPVFHLLQDSPSYAVGLWDWSVAHPDGMVASLGPMALGALRSSGRNVDAQLACAGQDEQAGVRRLAAGYLCGGSWFADPSPAELSMLEHLSQDDDAQVRSSISTTLLRLRDRAPELAIEQALNARIADDSDRDTDMLFATATEYGIDRLDQRQLKALASQLQTVREPGYFAHQALAEVGKCEPGRVIDVWVARLRNKNVNYGTNGYRAVPFHDYGVEMLGNAQSAERLKLHTRLLTEVGDLSGQRARDLGLLYWRLALPGLSDDEPDADRVTGRNQELKIAWQAIGDWAVRPSRDNIAHVLSEAPWQAVLAEPQVVADLLTLEDPLDEGSRMSIRAALRSATESGMHGRTIGEDSPRWKATIEQARTAGDALPAGSAGAQFFSDLEKMARRELERERREDEEERRGWH